MGFTIFFGVMNVIKFSHGDVLTLGAFGGLVAVWATHSLGLSVPLQFIAAFAAAMLLSAVAGAGISHFLIMPLRNAPPLNMLLMTMMVGTVLREAIRLFFPNGTNPQRFPELLPSGGFDIGSSFFRTDALILIVAGVASIGAVYWIINRTKFGLAMRAVAEDVETARTMGINFARVIPLTFALGSITAGFAGTIYGLYYSEIKLRHGAAARRDRFHRGHRRRPRQYLGRHHRRLPVRWPADLRGGGHPSHTPLPCCLSLRCD